MNVRNFGIASGLGGVGAGLMGMFGGQNNPYDAAKGAYDQIPGTISPYFQPYINAGQGALGQLQGQYGSLMGNLPGLQGQYNSLMNDPSAMFNKIAGGYHQSPGFQFQLGQGMNAANNAAAAGGMAGSPQHQQQAATMAEGLANQDFYNYMGQALGMYGTGLQGNQGLYNQGLAGMQGINQMGYNASNELAGGLASAVMNKGNMAFAGQAAQNQAQGSQMGDIFGGL
ncbi:MAG: hypothetical protein PHV62_08075, partial [Sulfuricurvum sp.]|nr:hypothetical protein [Sulfuricurvum sp.]